MHARTPAAVHIVDLSPDHPGFKDAAYRARRDAIAEIACNHRTKDPVPQAPYTDAEHAVWRRIARRLTPLHRRHACRAVIEMADAFRLDQDRIPQLVDVNDRLGPLTGFRMEPVAGLVGARDFLCALGRGTFLSTQYIRHHSRPWYTPEPDVVHELIGHAATLAHPELASLNRAFGQPAPSASPAEIERLIRVYWFTLEFGVVRESRDLKAVGAGLLSSVGEISSFAQDAELLPWDVAKVADTSYDPTDLQPRLFVAPSLARMLDDVGSWLASGGWRDA